jgi:hypothetical protein
MFSQISEKPADRFWVLSGIFRSPVKHRCGQSCTHTVDCIASSTTYASHLSVIYLSVNGRYFISNAGQIVGSSATLLVWVAKFLLYRSSCERPTRALFSSTFRYCSARSVRSDRLRPLANPNRNNFSCRHCAVFQVSLRQDHRLPLRPSQFQNLPRRQ